MSEETQKEFGLKDIDIPNKYKAVLPEGSYYNNMID